MRDVKKYIDNLKYSHFVNMVSKLVPEKHKKISKKNIEIIFGKYLNDHQLQKLENAFYKHTLLLLIELIIFSVLPKKKAISKINIKGLYNLNKAIKMNKGVIILGGHLGNFEVAPKFLPCYLNDIESKLFTIRKKIDRTRFAKSILGQFEKYGMCVIDSRKAARNVLRHLKNKSIILFAYDQRPKQNQRRVKNLFFGKNTETYTDIARISYKYKVPIIPMQTYRQGIFKHTIVFHDIVLPIKSSDIDEFIQLNTQRYNHILEKMILEYPEQWIYFYKRWKY